MKRDIKEKIKFIKALIKDIKKDCITKCEDHKDREWECFECLACGTVEFLERYIEILDDL